MFRRSKKGKGWACREQDDASRPGTKHPTIYDTPSILLSRGQPAFQRGGPLSSKTAPTRTHAFVYFVGSRPRAIVSSSGGPQGRDLCEFSPSIVLAFVLEPFLL